MNKTRSIQFRVTRQQFERIKNNANAKGYLNVSAYIRELALNKDQFIENKIMDIHAILIKNVNEKNSNPKIL